MFSPFQDLISKVDAKEDDLKSFNDSVDKCKDILDQNEGDSQTLEEAQNETNDKFKKARTALSERLAVLEEVNKKAVDFNESLDNIRKFTDDVSEEFEPKSNAPLPKDIEEIQKAIAEVDEALQKLTEPNSELQKDRQTGDWFIEKSKHDPMTTHEIQSRLDSTQEPLDKLANDLNDHKSKLVAAQHDQQALNEKIDGLSSNLEKLEELIADLKPVSALFTVSRQQNEELKVRQLVWPFVWTYLGSLFFLTIVYFAGCLNYPVIKEISFPLLFIRYFFSL